MCRCVCVRACAGEEREIATYLRLVRPSNWVGDRLASRLPYRERCLWETHRYGESRAAALASVCRCACVCACER